MRELKLEFVWTFCEIEKVESCNCHLLNSKLVFVHDFVRTTDNLLLKKQITTNQHECTMWYCEEASS